MEVNIAGIPVDVVRKSVKYIRITVLPPEGAVRVSAPRFVSNAAIARFVTDKAGWIRAQQEAVRSRPRPTVPQYVSGEPFPLWGERYTLRLEEGGKGMSLRLEGETAVLTVPPGTAADRRAAFVKEWYRSRLKEEITRRLPRWEEATGLRPASWHTKDMKTRWGTCSVKAGRLWFSLQLARRPLPCLDYVLLHELAHLKVANHGPAFVKLLDRHMPDWRERRKELNAQPMEPFLPED